MSYLLKNCTVYDGTGSLPYASDIYITGDEIAAIGQSMQADTVVDASGLALAPGFIDAHGHSDFTLLADSRAYGKIMQGITTEINGNCGMSAAPLIGDASAQREADLKAYGITHRWRSLDEYFKLLQAHGIPHNFATLAGHGNIRASVMGYASKKAGIEDLSLMCGLLKDCLQQGAIGLSSGLIYPPGIYSDIDELTSLVKCGAEASERFIYASHMRSEGARLIESIEEIISIGRASHAKVHVSHIKTLGRDNFHKIGDALQALQSARKEGIRITADRYPYTASSTDLDSVLPAWAFEGGNAEELKRLKDPAISARIKIELEACGTDWDKTFISQVETNANKWMEGLSVREIAQETGRGIGETVINLLVDEGLKAGAIFHSMSEDNMTRFLDTPFIMLGTDSSVRSFDGPTASGKPHPRGFGSFPKFLKIFKGNLPNAISKITSLPAKTFGIQNRGMIKEGFKADLVLFSVQDISDTATYKEPFSPPKGIKLVFVNGVPAVWDGKPTGNAPGRVLRHGG